MDNYSEAELDTEISVKLTLRDLLILSWGHEAVSFVPGEESDQEFKVAEKKIDQTLDMLRSRARQPVGKSPRTEEAEYADPLDPALAKIRALRDELRAMGFACDYTIRAPSGARAPVVYLFAGTADADVGHAHNDRRPGY
jgi:hypothetical protein